TISIPSPMTTALSMRWLEGFAAGWMSDTKFSVDGTVMTVVARPEDAGLRLDKFLANAFADFSRSRLEGLIDAGALALNAKTIRDANHRVKPGENYTLAVPPAKSARPRGEDIPLSVVYEPAGLVVHPAAGNPDGTLVNALIAHCGEELIGIGGEARPGIVHRLDKDTSGLLVAAKNERAMKSLAKQFANHTIERAYHAVVWGAPRAGEGRIEGEIG